MSAKQRSKQLTAGIAKTGSALCVSRSIAWCMIQRKDRQSTRCRERPQQRNGEGHHTRDDRREV